MPAQVALLFRHHEVHDFPGSDQERKTADPGAYERGPSPPPPSFRTDREEAERQSKDGGCRAADRPEGQGDRAETPEASEDGESRPQANRRMLTRTHRGEGSQRS